MVGVWLLGADALQTFATARRYLSCGDRTIFSEVITWVLWAPGTG